MACEPRGTDRPMAVGVWRAARWMDGAPHVARLVLRWLGGACDGLVCEYAVVSQGRAETGQGRSRGRVHSVTRQDGLGRLGWQVDGGLARCVLHLHASVE